MTTGEASVGWVDAAKTSLDLAVRADRAHKQEEELSDAKTELGKLLEQFRALEDSALIATPLGWRGINPNPEVHRDLDDALDSLDSRPLSRIPRSLGQYERDLRSSLSDHWDEHVASQLGNVAELLALSQALSNVKGMAALSNEFGQTLLALIRTQSRPPSSDGLELLAKAKDARRTLANSLKPESVSHFLSNVAGGGASLEDVSDDVLEWLRGNGSLDRFKVVARSQGGSANA